MLSSRQGSATKRRRYSSNTKTKFSFELPKINKTAFSIHINRQSKIYSSYSYTQRVDWVNEPTNYSQLTDKQVENQYNKLRNELQSLNEEVVKTVEKFPLKKVEIAKPQIKNPSKTLEVSTKEVENNNDILVRLKRECYLLQKRASEVSTIEKSKIEDEIQETKEKTKKLKYKINDFKIKNKTNGKAIVSIVDTDKLFDQIRNLQNERQMQERKRFKLHKKNNEINDSLAESDYKLQEIEQSYGKAQEFFAQQNEKIYEENNQKQLQFKLRHLKHCLEVNEKKNQIQNNVKQQKYHVSLKKLQSFATQQAAVNNRLSELERGLFQGNRTIEELERKVKQLKKQSKVINQVPFFTEYEEDTKTKNDETKTSEKKKIQIIEEEKDQIMQLDDKFVSKTKHSKLKLNDSETQMEEKENGDEQSEQSDEESQEKKQIKIDLPSIEDGVKNMNSLQLNEHEVIVKSRQNSPMI